MQFLKLFTPIVALFTFGCGQEQVAAPAPVESTHRFNERQEMVAEQIAARGIKNRRVLEAMKKVPRHEFIPSLFQDSAYEDTPVSIGHGQTISQPYIVAFMTEALDLKPTDKVLEIGTGCGYQSALLAVLAKDVYTIEIVEPLAKQAKERLTRLGYKNVHTRTGDGYRGWPEEQPFDAIIVTAAPDHIPRALVEQLGEGGRLIIPVGSDHQNLVLMTKKDGKMSQKTLFPVRFVPMTGEAVNRKGVD